MCGGEYTLLCFLDCSTCYGRVGAYGTRTKGKCERYACGNPRYGYGCVGRSATCERARGGGDTETRIPRVGGRLHFRYRHLAGLPEGTESRVPTRTPSRLDG